MNRQRLSHWCRCQSSPAGTEKPRAWGVSGLADAAQLSVRWVHFPGARERSGVDQLSSTWRGITKWWYYSRRMEIIT